MQVKTRVKAGGMPFNHNETLVRATGQPKGLTVKTHVKAGVRYAIAANHNETPVRDMPRKRTRV